MSTTESETVIAENHNGLAYVEIKRGRTLLFSYTAHCHEIYKIRQALRVCKEIDAQLRLAAFQRLERIEWEYQTYLDELQEQPVVKFCQPVHSTDNDWLPFLIVSLAGGLLIYVFTRAIMEFGL